MHTTAMLFTMSIPDWNSLDSVRRAHSVLEAVALIFFALLVLFETLSHLTEGKKRERMLDKIGLCCFAVAVLAEIVAYPYGRRNDTLSEQIIGSLDAKAKEASNTASDALIKSGEAKSKAADADIAAGKAQQKADAVSKRAREVEANLSTTIAALRQPAFTQAEIDALAAELKLCPRRTTTPVLVYGEFFSDATLPIWGALNQAGFTKVDLQMSRVAWYGLSTHGSLADADVQACIRNALAKRLVLGGLMGVADPPTSPVTIEIGERPLGVLPKKK